MSRKAMFGMTCLICMVIMAGCGKKTVQETELQTDMTMEDSRIEIPKEMSQPVEQLNATKQIQAKDEVEKTDDGTPVEKHGSLHVDGANLVDQNGEPFQLYGMSTHGIAWFPQYITFDTFRTLRDDWNTNCIRIVMYTAENEGYCTGGNQQYLKNLVKQGVEYATELGMYVIIDWHVLRDESPLVYQDEAVLFFDEMSKEYAQNDNVIYEICNEPNGSGNWESVKAYANTVIPVIRANNQDAIILVGTPTWSQDIENAMRAPLPYTNIMYVLHFYAATHTDWLRDRMTACIEQGTPIFISEFGICDASGNGGIDYQQAEEWKNMIEKYGISFMSWNLANKQETSSVIREGCSKVSDWDDSELSESGIYIKNWFCGKKQQ